MPLKPKFGIRDDGLLDWTLSPRAREVDVTAPGALTGQSLTLGAIRMLAYADSRGSPVSLAGAKAADLRDVGAFMREKFAEISTMKDKAAATSALARWTRIKTELGITEAALVEAAKPPPGTQIVKVGLPVVKASAKRSGR